MNLPFSAYLFFPYALKIISNISIINYYDIINEEEINDLIARLQNIAKENRIDLTSFNVKKIKTYAPREFYIGIDITAKK